MNKPAAIYARVSSDPSESHHSQSQTAALIEYAQKNGYERSGGMGISGRRL